MARSFSAKHLADLSGSTLVGDPEYLLSDVDDLENAGPEDVSFLANPRYEEMMKLSKAGLICIHNKASFPEGKQYLLSENPSSTFQKIVELIYKEKLQIATWSGIHPTAIIAPDVIIGENVTIGPYCTIDSGCSIGSGSYLHPHVTLFPCVKIGTSCTLYPQSVVREHCELGNRVILQPGAIIGSCGFGYITENGRHNKLNQIGNVIIEDDCEIGANTCIDRARFKSTRIKTGTKIDNLVQIAHNVELGAHNIIVSQTGISGSSKTGKYVVMGGQVGVAGHVEIGDFIQIASRGGVSKSITETGAYRGSPVMPLKEYNRYKVQVRNIEKHLKKMTLLEEKIKKLEEALS